MKKRIFTFYFIFLFGCLISCNNDPVVNSLKKSEKNTSASESKKIVDTKNQKLSSMLYELAISPNHDHGIIIEKSSADMTRGLVAVDQLIPLSEEPVIQSIRLPDRLIKAREINP